MEAPTYPRKFFKEASAAHTESGWQVLLDGRPARTPGRNLLATESQQLAQAMAEEWNELTDEINPYLMPLSRCRMVVLDQAQTDAQKWHEIIIDYLCSDLLCYRATHPSDLIDRQEQHWGPFLHWFSEQTGRKLSVTSGIISIAQPAETVESVRKMIIGLDADVLSCLAAATQITGSAVLALSLWKRAEQPQVIFEASRLDEIYQAEKWGIDTEAQENENRLRADFLSIATYLRLTQSDT
ncbi:ATP12 family chaperone protein [Parvularcula sp. IMCC14364]|uniref:ATP12 family chaperone protein n=1 Tax=Parvularcula sp. IMCC14364 TaxID=3067902 RepID=UPI0027404CEB|nr:ATP12 family protein [Parvularcula sp. IMCC14364]